jgi:probable DNA metabolism protein
MVVVGLGEGTDFAEWRDVARGLRVAAVAPDQIDWTDCGAGGEGLAEGFVPFAGVADGFSVPREFVQLAEAAICHRTPERFDLLYRLLWRLKDEPDLLQDASDPTTSRARQLFAEVVRESLRMKAFLRFRQVQTEPEAFAAWIAPTHRVALRTAPFFTRRFGARRFSILTPDACVHWNGRELMRTPGAEALAVERVGLEDFWRLAFEPLFALEFRNSP